MRWNLKTPPANEPLDLNEALTHCNLATVEGCAPEEARYVQGLIRKARSFMEQMEDRQLITAEWLVYMDGLPLSNGTIEIRGRLPLQEVNAIRVRDTSGAFVEMPPEEYQVDAIDRDKPGRIKPNPGYVWQTPGAGFLNSVEIELKAGYGMDHTSIPESAKEGLLYMVAEMYAVREPISTMRIERIESNALELALDLICWGGYR